MNEKKCFKCGAVKPLEQFYKHAKMGDGHLGKCIKCTKKDTAERETRLRNTDPEWVKMERVRCRIKQEKRRAAGIKDPSPGSSNRWAKRNRYKRNAEQQLNRALKKGIVTKLHACEDCGSNVYTEAHHYDYNLPLSVVWLCKKCHMKRHRKDLV